MPDFFTSRDNTLVQLVADQRRLTTDDQAYIERSLPLVRIKRIIKLVEGSDGDLPARNADLLHEGRLGFVVTSVQSGASLGFYKIRYEPDQIRAFNLTDDLRGIARIVKARAVMDGLAIDPSSGIGSRPAPQSGPPL